MPESNLIFVSYAHPNLALVRKLVRFLQTDHFANRNSDGASRMDLGRLFKHQALRQK
jgi:hypothetical protein